MCSRCRSKTAACRRSSLRRSRARGGPSDGSELRGTLGYTRVTDSTRTAGASALPPDEYAVACRSQTCLPLPRCLPHLLFAAAACIAVTGCHRENRYFEPPPSSDVAPAQLQLSALVAGQSSTHFREQQRKMYEENAHHVSEGKRLYSWFNCVGCHAQGGGDSGPALMDDQWIYGGEIDQIYLTILQGRPNGMPAFGGKIPSQQIWQLAAYVRSMGGHGSKSARPGRDDHIQKPSEQGRRDRDIIGAPSNDNF
jgi:cytochrome c oxidase cbb3-type subunit III